MSETVTFTLDGNEISAQTGQTIWDVTKGQGFIIPHLCHRDEPGYRSDGNCRACMVEVEGERTLVASCIRPVSNGMVCLLYTSPSPRDVEESRMPSSA